MADESRSIWESIRLWLTAVGIPVVLAVAGFWQFYLKEVWWPAAAINLTTEVAIKEVGLNARPETEAKDLEAIELVITARNPSSSAVYLCSNFWLAIGETIGGSKQEKDENWIEDMTKAINSDAWSRYGKHYVPKEGVLVAGGQAFMDLGLRPNEKTSITHIFYIQKGRYDHLEVMVLVPTTSRVNPVSGVLPAVKINWEFLANGSFKFASMARVMPDGTQEQIPLDARGFPSERDRKYYGLQAAISKAGLSLWQNKVSPSIKTERPEASSLWHNGD